MPQWEYTTLLVWESGKKAPHINGVEHVDLRQVPPFELLNQLGRTGWEAVASSAAASGRWSVLLKRPIG